MSALNENALALVGSALTVNMNADADTTLFTVPVGKSFVPFAVLISNASADLGNAVASFGISGGATDFLGNQTLSGIDSADDAGWLMPVPAATTNAIVMYAAGEVFVMDITTVAGGAATADVYLFGFVTDA